MRTPERIEIFAVAWPEVDAGADLAELLVGSAQLESGDVVVLTSKVVSKSEGEVYDGQRTDAVAAEAVRVVARRGEVVIAQTRHGLVMAAAGVDASNVETGTFVTLPGDPDESARRIRTRVFDLVHVNVAVVVTDTAGRAWRNGQTDLAVGCAGLPALVDLQGSLDTHGNVLAVTAPAIADELAAAGDLVKGKATGRPVAVVRGLANGVLAPGDHGPGAAALIRDSTLDLFGLGAREAAVAAATRTDPVALAHFAPPVEADAAPFAALQCDDDRLRLTVTSRPGEDGAAGWLVQIDVRSEVDDGVDDEADAGVDAGVLLQAGQLLERAHVLAAAHRLRPAVPVPLSPPGVSWRTVAGARWTCT